MNKKPGLVFLGIIFVLFSIIVIVFLRNYVFDYPNTVYLLDPDRASFLVTQIQTAAEIILIPVAIIGFFISITEYRKNLYSPRLKLFFKNHDIKNDQYITISEKISSNEKTFKPNAIPVLLTNINNSVATIYCIEIEINTNFSGFILSTHSGGRFVDLPKISTDTGFKWVINVNGEHPSYPYQTREIFYIRSSHIFLPLENNGKFVFRYKIFTDKSQMVDEALVLSLDVTFDN